MIRISTIAIAVMLGTTTAHGVNLLNNGDFETGDLSGWTTWAAGGAAATPPPSTAGSPAGWTTTRSS